jgi:WAS/WASL-interacting protein
MDTARPLSGPASVWLAGVTLVGLAAASFTSGLSHQLNQPRPDHSAKVIVIAPLEPAPPVAATPQLALASTAAQAAPPAPHRRLRPTVDPTVDLVSAPPPPQSTTPTGTAGDVAATAPAPPAPGPASAPDAAPPY